MNQINAIVTIKYHNQDHDVELPINVALRYLKPLIKKGLNLNGDFSLSTSEGILNDANTLFSAGVLDGCFLYIK